MHIQVTSPIFKQFYAQTKQPLQQCEMVQKFCSEFKLPDDTRNHADFNEELVQKIASYKEQAIKPVCDMLQTANNEKDITAGLFLINRIIDAGAKNVGDYYHIFSKFNYNKSPNVQVMLAGIYRKTLVPDGFGPLMTMLIQNSQAPTIKPFDAQEEVGGAILEYLRNASAVNNYKSLKKS